MGIRCSVGSRICHVISITVYHPIVITIDDTRRGDSISRDAVTGVPVGGASVLVACLWHKAKNDSYKITNKPEHFLEPVSRGAGGWKRLTVLVVHKP